MTHEGAAETKKEARVTAPHWTTLTYKRDAAFGERIFVNMPYRSHVERGNKLTMWISPLIGHEDEPGAWRFHAKSDGAHLEEGETLDLLAGVFTLLAGHGYTPENLAFSTLAAIAQRPQHHIPATQREAAKRHIARQKQLGRGIERVR